MERSFGICNLSVVPVRSEPSDRSEMCTQLLFGDCFEIIEQAEKWVCIRTAYDEYEGWIDPRQFTGISAEVFSQLNQQHFITGLLIYQSIKTVSGEMINLVPGSSLPFFSDNSIYINDMKFEFSGVAVQPDIKTFPAQISRAAGFYLHAPYLWGGKSPFGIDCSGFTQMVFKQFGIRIRRDTWQQAEQGVAINSLRDAGAGDLAFFDNAEGRIVHVGILLGNRKIIHGSGRVRIDSIDEQGIYNDDRASYTHKLKLIRRYHQ